MPRNPKLYLQSKKHQARIERERITRRYITIGSVIAITLVVLIVGYGLLDQYYLRNVRPVAVVNGERIETKDWQALVRYSRQRLINQAVNVLQNYQIYAQFYGPDFFTAQLQQIQQQLSPTVIGEQTLDNMIESVILYQEAKKRNITVTEEEIDQKIKEVFEYFPNGTPTALPTYPSVATSTLSPTQYALVSPTPTSTATAIPTSTPTLSLTATVTATLTTVETAMVTPTVTPTSGPTATPTPYTLEAFQADYGELLKNYQEQIQFSEQDLRKIVRNQILYAKMQDAIAKELGLTPEQEMVWARHILVDNEETAKQIIEKLNNGEDWTALAAQYSTDTSNKDSGGDLGWFYHGMMVAEFENAAFALKIGEISQPVKTQYGFHIIQVLGHEKRYLSEEEFEQLKQNKFQAWLTEQRSKATIKIDESWRDRVPEIPAVPPELQQAIDQLTQGQPQALPQPTP
jgi:parvulin-like peptidyl-prolyl isomerase